MGDGYVKIYGDRLRNSSLWLESWQARLVFVEMLAIADRNGHVNTPSVRVLANALNLSVEDTQAGLDVLEAPDPESRTDVEGGRRLLRVQGGWDIVNYKHYREFRTQKQEADRLRALEKRQAQKRTEGVDGKRDASATHATNRDVGDESQRPRRVALPASASGSGSEISLSEISEKSTERANTGVFGPGSDVGWTAVNQSTAFVRIWEGIQRVTPSLHGKHVHSFHAEVLRTAELQGVHPRALFEATAEQWVKSPLDERARSFPYAALQAAWGGLTSKGAAAPPAGSQAPETASSLKARAGKALGDGDHAECARLMARAKEIEAAEEARRGRR